MGEHWSPKANAYLERVPKALILAAVREGVSERDAKRLAGLKKGAMAEVAGELLAKAHWLPALLKTAAHPEGAAEAVAA